MTDPIDPAIVEVAAQATYVANSYSDSPAWDELADDVRELVREQVRIALKAAAPLVAAKALLEAAEAMRSCKDPGHWNLRDPQDPETSYSPDVWLLARADDLTRKDT